MILQNASKHTLNVLYSRKLHSLAKEFLKFTNDKPKLREATQNIICEVSNEISRRARVNESTIVINRINKNQARLKKWFGMSNN